MEDYLIRLYDLKRILLYKARLILKNYSEEDLEDIVHNNILKMYDKINRGLYKPEKGEISTWAGNVVSNACLDILRRDKVKGKAWDRLKDNSEHHYIDHESDKVEFTKKQLKLMIKSLPPKYCEIINLYYFSDMTFLEISEKININHNTVKVQAFTARNLLRDKIEKFNRNSLEKITIND